MGVMNQKPQSEPLHYGEVHGIWSFLLATKGTLARYQVFINHAGDAELRRFLEEQIQHVIKPGIEQAETMLKENGVALPPAPPERPIASPDNIPPGARVNDPEIAAEVSADLVAALVLCSQMMGQAVREDVHTMFGQIHTKKAQAGLQLMRLLKAKGWLVVPPLHLEKPEPVHA